MKRFLNKKTIFILTMIFCLNATRSDAMAKKQEPDLKRFKEKFDIQIKLYNGETLPQLIPSVEGDITKHEDILKGIKYFYISALYKGVGTAYLTLDITSTNNRSLRRSNQHLRLHWGIKQHILLCAGTPAMDTDEKDVILDYEIKDVWFK